MANEDPLEKSTPVEWRTAFPSNFRAPEGSLITDKHESVVSQGR
jgi:hypothetical protein